MLPRMTKGNWIFWGIIAWIGINFIWIALLERFVTQWIGVIIASAVMIVLIKYGPRPEEEAEAESEEEE